ncbi:hypothetical protein SORBI_3002G057200 [Sorghum bicolor]|uniref:TPX2 C-terminal domain-containing protein n=1 Tax=Sorghum bicolor TaxID=4558 RepID=A0A1B6Q9I0_SORBI|nr:hypothetical protein SORBI_3002G057200 [Sorghum bicolor]
MNSHMDTNGLEDVSVNPDLLKLIHQQESSVTNSPAKPVARQQGSSHTVPEPCTVAPDRRSSRAGNCAPIPHPTSSGEKNSDNRRAGKTKKTTVAVAPTFVCANCAKKRGEFYTKLEEKRKALEEEKLQAEARKREEEEEALRQLRKNMVV